MRIGIITHNYPKTSSERIDAGVLIYDFAQELAKHHKVFVLCPDFSGKKEKYKKVPVTWFSWGGHKEKLGSWKLFSPSSLFKFFQLIFEGRKAAITFAKEKKLDFCLAAWAMPSGIFANSIRNSLGTPYALWSLGSDINKYAKYPILRQLIGLSLKNADVRFANSFLLCKKVKSFVGKKCNFLPGVTNIRVVKSKRKTLAPQVCNFLFVGRLEHVKGPDILIEAISLVENNQKFVLHILGDGSMKDELSDRVKKAGLDKNIFFYGFASETQVSEKMQLADCLVVPSRSESLPLVMVEASKHGLPVIAADVGDCKRIIDRYSIGLSVPKENPQRLALALKKFIRNKKLIKKRSKIGLARMSKDFNQEMAVEIFMKHAERLL